jgi:UDP-2,3-diacylglucosamine hydrolase
MKTLKRTIFISDLHLEETRPDIAQRFVQLLKNCDSSVDALYILGDLFEVWIGDDDNSPFHQEIFNALKSATQNGLVIYFMRGNRDFLIGRKFLRATDCRLLSDEEIIVLYNTPVLLMHGDTLCTRDMAYLKARRKARNRFLQTLFLLLPITYRRKIADKMRAKSLQHTQSASLHIMDVTQSEVVRVMQKHGVNFLIHGHTHRPQFHELSLNHESAERIVLGAWHQKGNMLIWDAAGKKEWIEF